MNLATIVNFESLRAYRRLLKTAGPDPRLYDYLETQGVYLRHVINLLDGAIAHQPYNFDNRYGLAEHAFALPVLEPDDVTPLDVVVCSMDRPPQFACLLKLGGVLGANAVVNPATYAGGERCRRRAARSSRSSATTRGGMSVGSTSIRSAIRRASTRSARTRN